MKISIDPTTHKALTQGSDYQRSIALVRELIKLNLELIEPALKRLPPEKQKAFIRDNINRSIDFLRENPLPMKGFDVSVLDYFEYDIDGGNA